MMDTTVPVSSVLAVVSGHPVTEMPLDLFIPPDALEVLLDSFTGPLDLLLYLIRQQKIDMMDIPMAKITAQYMQYIDLLEQHRMALAADYLVMAAVLAEIKSRMLLPVRAVLGEEIEEDPRMALVRRLQSYEQMKQAAVMIDRLPRVERDFFLVHIDTEHPARSPVWPDVGLSSLVVAMLGLMQREQHQMHHQITREVLSVRERMRFILQRLQQEPMLELTQILKHSEGRMGLVVTFLGLLELAKQSLVVIAQIDAYAAIHIWLNAHE